MSSVKVFHKTSVATHGMVREFTPELHGEDYQEVAKSYAKNYSHNVDHVEGLDEENEPSEREALIEKATGYGIEFKKNVKTEVLAQLVADYEEENK